MRPPRIPNKTVACKLAKFYSFKELDDYSRRMQSLYHDSGRYAPFKTIQNLFELAKQLSEEPKK